MSFRKSSLQGTNFWSVSQEIWNGLLQKMVYIELPVLVLLLQEQLVEQEQWNPIQTMIIIIVRSLNNREVYVWYHQS